MGRYVSSIKSVANVMKVTEYTVKTWIKRNKLKSIVSKNEGRIITKKELFEDRLQSLKANSKLYSLKDFINNIK